MQTEDAVSNHRRHRQIVKSVGKMLPHICIPIFPETFVVESINLGDLTTLMISSENGDAVSVSDFQSDEKSDGFQRIISPINIVSHEQVICFRAVAADTEKLS